MLHRTGLRVPEGSLSARKGSAAGPANVLLAVAPPPRLGSPTRWGWPHWLAPAYRAARQHHASSRPLEDYG
jgi:hypothetical protein